MSVVLIASRPPAASSTAGHSVSSSCWMLALGVCAAFAPTGARCSSARSTRAFRLRTATASLGATPWKRGVDHESEQHGGSHRRSPPRGHRHASSWWRTYEKPSTALLPANRMVEGDRGLVGHRRRDPVAETWGRSRSRAGAPRRCATTARSTNLDDVKGLVPTIPLGAGRDPARGPLRITWSEDARACL